MRLLFIVDARSPIANGWISLFEGSHEIHVVSTFPVEHVPYETASLQNAAVGFPVAQRPGAVTRRRGGSIWRLYTDLRFRFGALDVLRHRRRVRTIVAQIQPDLVHAMRIPFEAILAADAMADVGIPLVTSVWGNDFTYWSERFRITAAGARRAMQRTDGLHADCHRDVTLAARYRFAPSKPTVVLPGAGGVDTDIFKPGPPSSHVLGRLRTDPGSWVVVNPRGIRPYVRTDAFFEAAAKVLESIPGVTFVATGVEGHEIIERLVDRLGIASRVRLLPAISHEEMAELFRAAHVTVSPSEHDGIPNSLLEAMACGSFPVVGNIESLREWITPGENGLFCDPADPASIADSVLQALAQVDLRKSAARRNMRLIEERAMRNKTPARAEAFYDRVLELRGS